MRKSITITLITTTIVASAVAIAWAVLPAGTLPGDDPVKQQTVTQYVAKHRQVKVVRFIHKKDPVVAVAASSAPSGAAADNQSAGTSYAQPVPVVQRSAPTAPAAAQPSKHEDSQERENHDKERDHEDGEEQDG